MERFNRDEMIKCLKQEMDIPQVVSRQVSQGIGPFDPSIFVIYMQRRRAAEAAATSKLEGMDELSLGRLCWSPGQVNEFQYEFGLEAAPVWYAGGFNVEDQKPNWTNWAFMDFWTIEEATCLSIGFEPQKMPKDKSFVSTPSEPLQFYWTRMEHIRRAGLCEAAWPEQVIPSRLIQWAKKKKLQIPDGLAAAFHENFAKATPAMLEKVDRRRYDSALTVILGLLSDGYGYREGQVDAEKRKYINDGLKQLRLSTSPKTLKEVLDDVSEGLSRFVKKQEERDEKSD